MSIDDRIRWEEKHRRESGLSPRASVLAIPPPQHEGARALDVACGQGRHTAALAQAGYRVVAMDIAMAALQRVRAVSGGDRVLAVQADADTWPFASGAFDLIVQVDFLDRRLFPVLRDALKQDGLLFLDTFLDRGRPNAEGPSNPDFLLKRGELPEAFGDFSIESYEETNGDSARATMLARRQLR